MAYICLPITQLDKALSSADADATGIELASLHAAATGSAAAKCPVFYAHSFTRSVQGMSTFYRAGGPTPSLSGLKLYKGAVPTQAEFKANTPSTAPTDGKGQTSVALDLPYRSADRLLDMPLNASRSANISAGIVTIGLDAAAARGSGTATWFIALTSGGYAWDGNWGTGPTYAFMGTVGIEGSGADLELTSTEIATGNIYRLGRVRLPFQNVFKV